MTTVQKLTVDELVKEVARRRTQLAKRESQLSAELDGVRAELAALDGAPGEVRPSRNKERRSRSRRRNKLPLSDTLASVFKKNEPMGISEAMSAVQKAGYKTAAANFRTMVNQALLNDERFKKVGRGQYVLV